MKVCSALKRNPAIYYGRGPDFFKQNEMRRDLDQNGTETCMRLQLKCVEFMSLYAMAITKAQLKLCQCQAQAALA
jgi:hypothetical protein